MRICSGCHQELDESSFTYRKPGVLYKKCKPCRLKVTKESLAADPERAEAYKTYQKEWYAVNRDRLSKERKSYREKTGVGKWYYLWHIYRLKQETYLEIFNNQGGRCAVCDQEKRLYVDHDHSCCPGHLSCGQCVRGLICQKCNMFMHYVDEYDLFEKAKKYSVSRVHNPDSRSK